MKKAIRVFLILLVIFVAGVIMFSLQINRRQEPENTEEATGPTLPVVFMEIDGTDVNEMFGVRGNLQETSERDSVTPLPSSKKLSFRIDPKESEITGVSYEISSIADESLVENGEITDQKTGEDGSVTASFTANSNLRSGQEYMLCIDLKLKSGDDVRYYTRLVQGSGIDFSGYLKFVSDFGTMCLDKSNQDTLAGYLETDDSGTSGDFTDVDITSDTDTVTWGDLSPSMVTEAVPVICECNTTTVSMEADYIISSKDSEGETEYYKVKDFYRMKYADGTTNISLLNFKRTAALIFDSSLPVLTDSGLLLGVQDSSISYASSETGNIAVFAENGDLWSYNTETGALSCLFSFREKANGSYTFDDRTENEQHDFAIENVSENGDVTFVLYGYMPSGAHEGRMGAAVFTYSANTDISEERMFIPLNQSYDVLERNISRLSYVSSKDELYLFLGTELCKINLADGSYDVVQDTIDRSGFASSDSQQVVAWLDSDNTGGSKTATMLDLESGKSLQIPAPDGEAIVSCGFVDNDYVYGLVKDEDVITGSDGTITCGMYRLVIEDINGTVKKDYQKENQYVTAVSEEHDALALRLSALSDGTYRDAGTDRIVKNGQEDTGVGISTTTDSRTGQEKVLTLGNGSAEKITQKSAEILYTKAGAETILEWPETDQNLYSVYGFGTLQGIYSSVNRAIAAADGVSGLVLDSAQRYVWVRGDWPSSYTIDTATIPEGFLELAYDSDALGNLLGSGYTVLNLSGCTREELYYQLSKGYPVLARVSDSSVYYVIGYDEYNIWIYDKTSGKAKAVATDDADALFKKNSYQFLSYIAA
ncbi:hypothetical protein ACTQ1O_08310 [Bilifractor sp. LCP21S3_A7]|uniref:hypothetical protein n=1 Tax=Bilifractor sp. LCP21S3_A7 TaxID=3438738 RepID=UPI003F934C03